jgi:hypothetical protein
LSKYRDFSEAQVNQLIDAAITNSQSYNIFCDEDIFRFYDRLTTDDWALIDPQDQKQLLDMFRECDDAILMMSVGSIELVEFHNPLHGCFKSGTQK